MHRLLILDFLVLAGQVGEWVRTEQAGLLKIMLRLFGASHLLVSGLRLVNAQRLCDPVKLGLLIIVIASTVHHVILLRLLVVEVVLAANRQEIFAD